MAIQIKLPGTVSQDTATGSGSWNSIDNIKVNDTSYTDIGYVGDGANPQLTTYYLKATGFNFTIPTGSTIQGIIVEVEKYANANATRWWVRDNAVQLYKSNTLGGTDNKYASTWPTVIAPFTYGDATNLWGRTWTAEDINDANFGVAFQAVLNDNFSQQIEAYVDYIQVTVYYEPAYILNADTGQYQLTGNNAQLAITPTLIAASGAYNVTTLDITPRYFKLQCVTGTFTFTGLSAELPAPNTINARQGQFTLTGNTIDLSRTKKLETTSASYSLVGTNVNLLTNNPYPNPNSYFVLTGQSATLFVTIYEKTYAQPGVFDLVGNDVGLYHGYYLEAEPDSYVLTGNNVNLYWNRRLYADAGVFTLTGKTAKLRKPSLRRFDAYTNVRNVNSATTNHVIINSIK